MKLMRLLLLCTCVILSASLIGCAAGSKTDAEEAMKTLQPYTEHIDEILYNEDKVMLDPEAYDAKQNDTVDLFDKDGSITWYDLDGETIYTTGNHKNSTLIYGIAWDDNKFSSFDDFKKIVDSFAALYGEDFKEEERSPIMGDLHIVTWDSFELETLNGTSNASLEISFQESSNSDEGSITITITDQRSENYKKFKGVSSHS